MLARTYISRERSGNFPAELLDGDEAPLTAAAARDWPRGTCPAT